MSDCSSRDVIFLCCATMAPKFDPNEVKIVYVRQVQLLQNEKFFPCSATSCERYPKMIKTF